MHNRHSHPLDSQFRILRLNISRLVECFISSGTSAQVLVLGPRSLEENSWLDSEGKSKVVAKPIWYTGTTTKCIEENNKENIFNTQFLINNSLATL